MLLALTASSTDYWHVLGDTSRTWFNI